MTSDTLTPMQRTLATLGHREPDRVPVFLPLTLHGAKELGLSIEQYFAEPGNVVEGQLRLLTKYGHDCIYGFFFAGLELMAWGGGVMFFDDGPPNAAAPVIHRPEDILDLVPPEVAETPCLLDVLSAQRMLKSEVGDDVPIIGVVISPFSLPVMQMGFDHYLDLMLETPHLFERLMALNEEFCVAWANAQLEAGATAIVYFDPVASPTIVPRQRYLETGHPVAMRTLARISGPTAVHFASGRCMSIIGDVIDTGAAVIGASTLDDLSSVKDACRTKVAVLGNMDAIQMRHWSQEAAESTVKASIAAAGKGGGFILSDIHGEIPWQVPDEVLVDIVSAAKRWGRYPLDWAH